MTTLAKSKSYVHTLTRQVNLFWKLPIVSSGRYKINLVREYSWCSLIWPFGNFIFITINQMNVINRCLYCQLVNVCGSLTWVLCLLCAGEGNSEAWMSRWSPQSGFVFHGLSYWNFDRNVCPFISRSYSILTLLRVWHPLTRVARITRHKHEISLAGVLKRLKSLKMIWGALTLYSHIIILNL